MNDYYQTGSSPTHLGGETQARARAFLARSAAWLSSIGLGIALTGCSFLKPAQPTTRHFVLTPVPVTEPAEAASASIAVGLGQVKIPAYLFNTSLAIRKGGNEIQYLQSAVWAERLDTGFQRVLAANLATALPTDRIYLSNWNKDAVAVEVYITIEQFDVDTSGQGVLISRWRIVSPGGERILKTGSSRLTRQGPPPDTGAAGAITTLSELVADFGRQLAQALHQAMSARDAVVPNPSAPPP